ncbi:MAG: alpha-amylase family glycosyl hydrolase [Bacteroidota bacterium]
MKKNPRFEFHIAKEVRKKYEIDELFFSISGNVVFANNAAVRNFVKKINDKREPSEQVKVGEVNAAGLLDEIYHFLFRIYDVQINPGAIKKALEFLYTSLGEGEVRKLLFDFVEVFPPIDVYKGKADVYDYLNSFTSDRSNLAITLEELILLSFANINPANKNILELFDQNYLNEKKTYKKILIELEKFFVNEIKIGPDNQDLFTFFKTPILTNPDSIEAQLDFIHDKWGILLDERFLNRILSGKDLIKESIILGFGGVGGAPGFAPQYKEGTSDADFLTLGKSGYRYALDSWKDYEETERFTQDTDWMPRVVMIAKNIYVWLDQLSKKYQRHIKTIDQIPDEVLDQLANWGFNCLWLIGIWERSNSSRKIKHILGNIDAAASAYSLYDYQIAYDLGGEHAYNNLSERARNRGIRLASDMVPNHTGIFSKWVIERPDYFIQTPFPPFPNYRFSGPDLSDDQSIQLRIEDGYWSRTDAAVVFQRVDNRTGDVRYIYHGNDGTNMPWNDTAQLNMILAEVREAVIQKIFEVARKFSIIRFDAAMTLAKKHFSRLWFPVPGRGGDIPSRSDYSLSQEEFDRQFPVEFWREVVDRINSEMPDTLLLAEAFWLMEGYFVRTLGMHRVYNSAFMNMMMKEENAKYRDLISNTLEFEPEILKRYVNFMSNPDEETAIKQFGTDDKYFGVCTLMVTLPGLPMFAHGQIEGFTEKYGMEYQRAYYQESPNQWLVERHIREIFPLMKKRFLFSQVINFWLFDFYDNKGNLNENVFAYTNCERGEKALVFYNNKYEMTKGTIFHSSPKLVSFSNGEKIIQKRTLGEALNVNPTLQHYYIYRENVSNLEYLKSGHEFAFQGFQVELGAFKYLVYLNFYEVYDANGDYEKLARKLKGNGVPSIFRALQEMKLEPIHNAFENIFDEETVQEFISQFDINETDELNKCCQSISKKYGRFIKAVIKHFELDCDTKKNLNDFFDLMKKSKRVSALVNSYLSVKPDSIHRNNFHPFVLSSDSDYTGNSILLMHYFVISCLKNLLSGSGEINRNNFIEKMILITPIRNILKRSGKGEYELEKEILLLNVLLEFGEKSNSLFDDKTIMPDKSLDSDNVAAIQQLLGSEPIRLFMGVNQFEGITYYNKESFDELLSWFFSFQLINSADDEAKFLSGMMKKLNRYLELERLSDESNFILDRLIDKITINDF